MATSESGGSQPSIGALRRAKRGLVKKYEKRHWFRGAGIVPSANGLVLRIYVDPQVPLAADAIPATYYRIPIEIVETMGFSARDSAEDRETSD